MASHSQASTLRRIFLTLLAATGVMCAADPVARVSYAGGTVNAIPQGAPAMVKTADPDFLVMVTKEATLKVSYSRVNLLEYGQTASRRYALAVLLSPMFLLSKKRTHFLTVGFTDDEGRQQALVLAVAKEHIRVLLASLEARTGRQVEFQDEEARRSGRG